jgi:hypothetical protein
LGVRLRGLMGLCVSGTRLGIILRWMCAVAAGGVGRLLRYGHPTHDNKSTNSN